MQMDNMFLKACQNGQKGVVETFLKRGGIHINRVDNDGYTALHYACGRGARDIVKNLVANGADVCIASNKGITPLHMAAKTGNKDIIKLLVEQGADINATDNEGKSVVVYAVKAGKTDTVRFLKGLGADVTIADNDGKNAVDYVNIEGMTGMIENVLDGADIHADSFGNTPLHQSCYNGHSETVRVMLEMSGVEVDAVNNAGETPLYIAVRESHIYIAELLLGAGADVNRRNDSGESLLHIAAKQRKAYMVNTLIKGGADVNARNRNGETALICAIKSKEYQKPSVDIVEMLLNHEADVECTDMWGNSALFYATECGNAAIMEMLIEAGATN